MRGDSVGLDIRYDDTNGFDISTEVSYLPSVDQIYYPQCLYRKLFPVNNRSAFSYPDAIIHINKNTNWCVGVGDGASSDLKNLAYGMLRSVATALGIGSSVKKDSRNNVVFGFRDGMSVFDKNIFSESGKRMESLSNNSGKEFNDFVQQQNGCLYFYKKEKAYKLYAPSVFDEQTSLKYMLNDGYLMSLFAGGTKDLIVDPVTLDLLNIIGWKPYGNTEVEIIGEGIDETGITSAYQTHRFFLDTKGVTVSDYEWEYQLPLKDGTFETVATSVGTTDFIIPSITDENKYAHTIEGDIRGLIVFRGKVGNNQIKTTYNLTLELKPHILSVNIIKMEPSSTGKYYYDAEIDIFYEGSHYVHLNVEEEHSTISDTYFLYTPYYIRLKLHKIDSWGYALINVTVRNKYGSDNKVIEIPDNPLDKDYPTVNVSEIGIAETSKIDVYNSNGIFLGSVEDLSEIEKFKDRFLILKRYDEKGLCKTTKYIRK